MQNNEHPRLRVTAFVAKDDKYLLIKENIKSMSNDAYWLPPGGGVNYMEELESAAIREAKEETGLSVSVDRFITFKEVVEPENLLHTINFVYVVRPQDGDPTKEDKALDIQWFTKEEALKLNLTDLVRDVFANYL